jgi:hypothetical protein
VAEKKTPNLISFDVNNRIIMKTGELLFCATKPIIIARRAKERMYAVGGSGYIATEERVDRAVNFIYESFEQADRAAKSR